MSVPRSHIIHQKDVLAALGRTAFAAAVQNISKRKKTTLSLPGPVFSKTLPPRPASLIRDYIRHVGGDPGAYRNTLPAHMFPQWGFPLAARTLLGIPYPMMKVLNGGCRMEILSPLPANEPLEVSARLEDIDEDERRAVLHQKIVTGTRSAPEALVAHLYAIVPLSRSGKKSKKKPRVPLEAREIAYWKLRKDDGLSFALLTGDFNPVHWIKSYAKVFGFRNTILHGFSTMARTIEGIHRSLFAGSINRIKTFDCKFTKTLVLPAKTGLYLKKNQIFVGTAKGGPAFLTGSFE